MGHYGVFACSVDTRVRRPHRCGSPERVHPKVAVGDGGRGSVRQNRSGRDGRARKMGSITRGRQMSLQPPNAERQVWMFTQMLRIRTFEERVKRTFTEHPG